MALKVKLKHERETKGTHVYKDAAESAPIPSIYIKKSAFSGDAPDELTLEIKEL